MDTALMITQIQSNKYMMDTEIMKTWIRNEIQGFKVINT